MNIIEYTVKGMFVTLVAIGVVVSAPLWIPFFLVGWISSKTPIWKMFTD